MAGDRRAFEAKETFPAVGSVREAIPVFVDVLQHVVAHPLGTADKLRILQVDHILLVIVFVGQLAIPEYGYLAGTIAGVFQCEPPYFVRCAKRNVIQRPGAYACVFAYKFGVGCAVATYRAVCVQRFGYRLPAGGPEITGFVIPKVQVTPRFIKLVEGIAKNPPRRAGFNEAVTARVDGDDRAIFGRTQIVRPWGGGVGVGNHILARVLVKIAVLHGMPPYKYENVLVTDKTKTGSSNSFGPIIP